MNTLYPELRRRKFRPEKPFAILVKDLTEVAELCLLSDHEREILASPECPIVLLKRRGSSSIVEGVAPGNPFMGVMLPSTPVHYLMTHEMGKTPLVMTSGNRSEEPIACTEEEALERLRGIADLFLIHDRPIHLRCDDSVVRVLQSSDTGSDQGDSVLESRPIRILIRRSRGLAPCSVKIPVPSQTPILALGGQLKSTIALSSHAHAFLSPHLGGLDDYLSYQIFQKSIEHFESLLGITPLTLVHDLNPAYASTRYAVERARVSAKLGSLKRIAVQHHHAHVASCMAENGVTEPTIGVVFDGTGLGSDGMIWGGEFLVSDLLSFHRAAHFRYVALPGGEAAIREPWRMAVSYLVDAGLDEDLKLRCVAKAPGSAQTLRQIITHQVKSSIQTSSVGRLFDAVASLLGLKDQVAFDGQAAMGLEFLAMGSRTSGSYPFALDSRPSAQAEAVSIDTRPIIQAIVDELNQGVETAVIARRFHSTIVEIVVQVCESIRGSTAINRVALSGGVFMNALLLQGCLSRLSAEGFVVYFHRQVPPSDAGLALGQIAIAGAISRKKVSVCV